MVDVLTVDKVTAGYDKDPIIRDISFAVPKGSILGIIGPNGAGKTTLFRTISKLMRPWKGSVFYKAADISTMSQKEYAGHVAVIPQFRSVPPPFTVREFISMGRYPHSGRLARMNPEDISIVEHTLRLLKLENFKDKKVNALSGGEMQRVFLAQGLTQRPELILMDEPTIHLDITHKMRILDIIGSLAKESGLTALIILHDLNLTSAYCDHVVMMKKGEIFAKGTPLEILTGESISALYEANVRVGKDPVTQRPHVFFLPQKFTGIE